MHQGTSANFQVITISFVKGVWHAYYQLGVWFDQNFNTSRYNEAFEKIIYIKDIKNVYLRKVI